MCVGNIRLPKFNLAKPHVSDVHSKGEILAHSGMLDALPLIK